jgi:hypothetical protein
VSPDRKRQLLMGEFLERLNQQLDPVSIPAIGDYDSWLRDYLEIFEQLGSGLAGPGHDFLITLDDLWWCFEHS